MIKKENSFLIILAAAVILLALVIGNLFANQTLVTNNQNPNNEIQIKNDDVSSIEKDLQDLNFADIDKELTNIDQELIGF